ncbi:S41 family peptidase [Roseivirga pacifica]|uniref:S41 family peptidase n=1 Tax=Roseivirga pacifica TaxID=1267423 RepID=UPI003BB0C34E
MKLKMLFRACFGLLTVVLYQTVSAQGTMLLRQPTVSSTDIVFVYANDLWKVPKNGGNAIRLTTNIGGETNPHFSPDGKMIAFTGQYDGNADVYVIPATGGEPTRLTYHPSADNVTGWTPDGKVLFASARESVPTKESKFFTVSVNGGQPEALKIPRAVDGQLSADGKMIAYQQISFWDPEWRNYRGGQAKPIWIVDLKSLALKKTPQPDNERHTSPVWLNGLVYFLSERDFANNIWSFNPKTDELKQITFHADFDVKNLDAGGGSIVYEQGGYLHLLNPATGNAEQLNINVAGDMNWGSPRWVDARAFDLRNAQISPTGQRAIFEFRGDIITVPKENGNWRNLTNTSGVADRAPIWSPDGEKVAWFADPDGEYQLMVTDQKATEAPKVITLPNQTFYFRPQWSPDSKFIAYTDTDYNLWYVNVASGEAKKVDTDLYAHPTRSLNPEWSPDSKWIAYVQLQPNQYKAVKVHNIESGQTHQLTDAMADAMTPVWDESGDYLYFLASTTYGLGSGWLDMSSYNAPVTYSPYLIVLNKDGKTPFLPKSDEEPVGEKEKKESKEEVSVTIDVDGIAQRIVAIDVPARSYGGMLPGQKGHFFFTESVPNEGTKLNRYSIEEQKSITFLPSFSEGVVSADKKSLLYRAGASWGIVSTSGGAKKPGDGRLNISGVRIKVDPREEAKQIFREGWRYMRDFLYVDNTHGAPWQEVWEWYSPWIDHVRHRSDLNYVVDIMSGEIAVGHSYVSGGDYPSLESDRVGLLGADVVLDKNGFKIEKIYNGESWNPGLTAPLAQPGLDVNEGDYIVAIDGEPLNKNSNFYSYLVGTANRQVTLSLNSKASLDGAREVIVKTVSNERNLRSFDWVEGNRRMVDELSDGKLAYVYVPNTSGPGYTYFNRYYFAQQDKKGAVIDERNNGGGSAADYMVDIMSRKIQGYFNSRVAGNRPFPSPGAGIWGPKVMIINERAGSGGDLLPFLFRQMEIGPLVGTKTWGGLVGTWDTPPFIDNGRMVAPRGGFYNVDGEWDVEGLGIAPDILVEQTPKLVVDGKDPQLEEAVREALRLLKTEGVELKPEPAAPVRWKRPVKKN